MSSLGALPVEIKYMIAELYEAQAEHEVKVLVEQREAAARMYGRTKYNRGMCSDYCRHRSTVRCWNTAGVAERAADKVVRRAKKSMMHHYLFRCDPKVVRYGEVQRACAIAKKRAQLRGKIIRLAISCC